MYLFTLFVLPFLSVESFHLSIAVKGCELMRNLAEQNIANFRSNLQSNYCKNRYYTRIFILTVSIFYFTIFIFRKGRKHISTKEHIRKAEAFIVEPDIYNLHIIPLNQYQEKTINRHYKSMMQIHLLA